MGYAICLLLFLVIVFFDKVLLFFTHAGPFVQHSANRRVRKRMQTYDPAAYAFMSIGVWIIIVIVCIISMMATTT